MDSSHRFRAAATALTLLLLATVLPVGTAHAQDTAQQPVAMLDEQSALATLGRLVGGEWHLDDGYHVFEWGVGDLSVKSRSYVVSDDGPRLVSEGVWFWHPGEDALRGYHTAIGMPVYFFEYTTEVEGETLVHSLTSYGEMGGEYRETWELTDDDHYTWTLYRTTPDGETRMFGGVYERRSGEE